MLRLIGLICLMIGAAQAYRIYGATRATNALNVNTGNELKDQAARNVSAFLMMIRQAEGTAGANGYAICYGYRHTITDFSNHPAITGEWTGERLSDTMCINAGLSPGCVSTAAGAYQITKTTWGELRRRTSGLTDFSPANQDIAATRLIDWAGALSLVQAGNINAAIPKCSGRWASLPGNNYQQGAKSLSQLLTWYQQAGGTLA